MNYQEKVSTRADVRALYERVIADPTIARYRGYTSTKSYGWDETVGDYVKREGEVWFENPAYDPAHVTEGKGSEGGESTELLDERLEESERRMAELAAQKDALAEQNSAMKAKIEACESELEEMKSARDEALAAVAALRETLKAIQSLIEAV